MAEKLPRHKRMYQKTPKLERGEGGEMEVVHHSQEEADKAQAGVDGMKMHEMHPKEMRHMHERREMKHRHISEHHALHHKHEMEHAHHDMMGHGHKEELHKRHHAELKELHTKHEHEHKALHIKHEKEMDLGESHEMSTKKDGHGEHHKKHEKE